MMPNKITQLMELIWHFFVLSFCFIFNCTRWFLPIRTQSSGIPGRYLFDHQFIPVCTCPCRSFLTWQYFSTWQSNANTELDFPSVKFLVISKYWHWQYIRRKNFTELSKNFFQTFRSHKFLPRVNFEKFWQSALLHCPL